MFVYLRQYLFNLYLNLDKNVIVFKYLHKFKATFTNTLFDRNIAFKH